MNVGLSLVARVFAEKGNGGRALRSDFSGWLWVYIRLYVLAYDLKRRMIEANNVRL